uniref:Uncharacterized protein n=1 Tax=Palpitomonas bilix TaxID=652834 RepID=A0A7S3G510_9EUKA|mmetsp:Transcript_29771/g.76881  ORF Transcript_29771/g.76881 Transcript_29771/m.76881 type:complete len:297 (+) Transcript_29771:690-1580(+)
MLDLLVQTAPNALLDFLERRVFLANRVVETMAAVMMERVAVEYASVKLDGVVQTARCAQKITSDLLANLVYLVGPTECAWMVCQEQALVCVSMDGEATTVLIAQVDTMARHVNPAPALEEALAMTERMDPDVSATQDGEDRSAWSVRKDTLEVRARNVRLALQTLFASMAFRVTDRARAALAFKNLLAVHAYPTILDQTAHVVQTVENTARATKAWRATGFASVTHRGQEKPVMNVLQGNTARLAILALPAIQTVSATQRSVATAPAFVMKEQLALYANTAKLTTLVQVVRLALAA